MGALCGLSGDGSLHTSQINEHLVAMIRGKLTRHVKFSINLTFSAAGGGPDPSNFPSIPTTHP